MQPITDQTFISYVTDLSNYCLHVTTERPKEREQQHREERCVPSPHVGLQSSNPSFIESQLSHFDPLFFVREKSALPNGPTIVQHCWPTAN